MSAADRREEVVRFPIRTLDGHVDYAEIRNPRPATIEFLIKRLGAVLDGSSPEPIPRSTLSPAGRGHDRPAAPGGAGRPPKWQDVRDWILTLDSESGYAHTTTELHERFLGRKLSFIDPADTPIAKTTGTNHRKARRDIEHRIGLKWEGKAVGGRNQGGTTRWSLAKE
ncbi:MAG TPA: hypothetical protein VGU43_01595 [Thermoplasmata archaeon]|nr:hypothetical protein [Thermoplasmata archaeon]